MATSDVFTLPLDDLRELLSDWRRHLRAGNKAPSTIKSYLAVAEEFVEFLTAQGMPTSASAITREHIEHYLVHLQERPNRRTGKPLAAAHIAKHYRSLQQLFRWLDETEGEIDSSPFEKMHPPAVPEQPVPILTEDQLRALLATCKGNTFQNKRDLALMRMFLDTGARAGEVAPLKVTDIDFDADVAHVMGKGRRAHAVPFGAKTGEALRRYLRARARGEGRGQHRRTVGRPQRRADRVRYPAAARAPRGRCRRAAGAPAPVPAHLRPPVARRGRPGAGPHAAGWRSREMVGRYGASAADERARDAHRRAALGDRL